jgi:hypothetical protein
MKCVAPGKWAIEHATPLVEARPLVGKSTSLGCHLRGCLGAVSGLASCEIFSVGSRTSHPDMFQSRPPGQINRVAADSRSSKKHLRQGVSGRHSDSRGSGVHASLLFASVVPVGALETGGPTWMRYIVFPIDALEKISTGGANGGGLLWLALWARSAHLASMLNPPHRLATCRSRAFAHVSD